MKNQKLFHWGYLFQSQHIIMRTKDVSRKFERKENYIWNLLK